MHLQEAFHNSILPLLEKERHLPRVCFSLSHTRLWSGLHRDRQILWESYQCKINCRQEIVTSDECKVSLSDRFSPYLDI